MIGLSMLAQGIMVFGIVFIVGLIILFFISHFKMAKNVQIIKWTIEKKLGKMTDDEIRRLEMGKME